MVRTRAQAHGCVSMSRRGFLASLPMAAGAMPPRTKMGIATTCYMTVWKPKDTGEFLDHAYALGAGGIQSALSSLDPADIRKLRSRLEERGMYLEAMAPLPQSDPAQFERVVAAAKEAGALAIRTACLNGRRYETFATLEQWREFVAKSRAAIARAVPILEKHRMPMALENHKDWTVDEMVALLKEYSSRYVGVCLDTGNNMALLDDAMEVVERLAPFATSTHIKDMDVAEYKDGFLLSEVPLGAGFLDMKKVVGTIRRARPEVRMTLEMITRNPLQIPCLTPKYWVTFESREGRRLANALALARARRKRQTLPRLDGLDGKAQLGLEDDNVKQCLTYAREQLGL